MKKIKVLLAGLCVVATATTFAQQSPSRRGLSLSIGPEAALPLGTFHSNSGYKFGIGGSAKLNIPVATNIDISASAGYIGFSGSKLETVADKNTFTTIPFKGGIRFRTNGGFYFEPQAGYTQTKYSNSEGEGLFTYAANVGYLINRAVDISLRYEAMAAQNNRTVGEFNVNGESVKMLGLRVAYNIPFARAKQ
jgi:hypothetical protein